VKKRPPYDFILEELGDFVTDIKPMFGAFGIYHQNKILMILRKKENFDRDTGMWLGVVDEYVNEIKKEIPELRDLEMFGTSPTAWQVLGEDLESFETIAYQICGLILRNDPRIGRIPKRKLKAGTRKKVLTKRKPKKRA
jgi:hypothetical protein